MSDHSYPEIKRDDIRKGDVIREEYVPGQCIEGPFNRETHAIEYVASHDLHTVHPLATYFLAHRKPEMVEVPKEALDALEAELGEWEEAYDPDSVVGRAKALVAGRADR